MTEINIFIAEFLKEHWMSIRRALDEHSMSIGDKYIVCNSIFLSWLQLEYQEKERISNKIALKKQIMKENTGKYVSGAY